MTDAPKSPPHPLNQLPHSGGQSFATLDAYLAHLKERSVMDVPYYEQRADGTYELIIRRRPGTAPQIFTRCELAQKYGFDC